nr:hypothetical protein [Candidatus Brocadiales bacterium]
GACLVMQTSYFTVGLGMGDKLNDIRAFIAGLSGAGDMITSLNPISMRIAALFFMLYIVLIKITVGSIIVAFAGSASTIAYLIMRKDVDGTEMDDIYVDENEEDLAAEETVPEAPEEPAVQQAPEPIVPPEQKEVETSEESPEKNGLSPKNQE